MLNKKRLLRSEDRRENCNSDDAVSLSEGEHVCQVARVLLKAGPGESDSGIAGIAVLD